MWLKNTIELSQKSPDQLQSYQRGQVAHVVSTIRGARDFANAEKVPNAEWLCVFDPSIRYAMPGKMYDIDGSKKDYDPFSVYGLDSDQAPDKGDPENKSAGTSRKRTCRPGW